MGERHCVGCGMELMGKVISLEHSLPRWLAREIEMPGVSLRHFIHDETQPEADCLLRGHKLNTFEARKVCSACNGGWMSRIESSAKSLILDLMNQKISIMTLTDAHRTALARWATKTAFMIAVVQTTRFDPPWKIFQNLGLREEDGPNGSIVLATQQAEMPKGFLYTCPWDYLSEGQPIQVRVGFSLHHLQFVVVIPILQAPRLVAASLGLHIPLWPLDQHILVRYRPAVTKFETPRRYLDYLTNLIQVGVVDRDKMVRVEAAESVG
jgi:hypothetical protein